MNNRERRGFTLVELLVAVGITAVLAAVLLSLVARTVTLWEHSASALILENEAALVLEKFESDLQTAYRDLADLTVPWLSRNQEGEEFRELRLITDAAATAADANDPHTLREVSYRSLTDPTGGTVLYRLETTAAQTLASGYDWAVWPEVPDGEFLLAERVDLIDVQFYDANRVAMLTVEGSNWPRLARVELRLLTTDGAARVAAVEAGLSNESAGRIRAEAARTFVRWFEVGGLHR